MRQQGTSADNWKDFFEFAKLARANIGNPATVWYRGQSNTNYKLVPSLMRAEWSIQKEQDLFWEYERSANQLLPVRDNHWERLIDMQHFGLPTRLLDWTTVLGVAVAFALLDGDDTTDSAIYLLNPEALNLLSGRNSILRLSTSNLDFDYEGQYLRDAESVPQLPIAIETTYSNSRILAQKGVFTVHGSENEPFDGDPSQFVFKLVLGKGAKKEAKEYLEFADLNASRIYPDMIGMVRHLKLKYF